MWVIVILSSILSLLALCGVVFWVLRIGELRIHTHLARNPDVDRRRAGIDV